ncbi:hypothetical protein P153DRAFT_366526 [Dothidotthia symphoricarpi CBS 119687]|uniref:Uncharacterized protein n=1 Tax=Dothidotthia symphoricarpi CBS 119687 TaxID=1392245 RepID=A0A6A6AEQ6_9PLEO|nr:uncharacterized protein P153DRAFT_366526 [Dothidotthia symphoricarpi CBS 119687]KAF2130046.1 hypothetical protein P153DRAFT_366526 [Dothidotthia symphoricarpi CBS 119687]
MAETTQDVSTQDISSQFQGLWSLFLSVKCAYPLRTNLSPAHHWHEHFEHLQVPRCNER